MTSTQILVPFGFTETESQLYCALLEAAPASGYRLAQRIGKAPANTYQALAALVQKGAVMVDEGTARAFRPVPPQELLGKLQREFETRRKEAATEFAKIVRKPERDGIFQIRETGALYARAEQVIAEAQDILLFDLFPLPFAKLAQALRGAHKRGVCVAGIVYAEVAEPFVTVRPDGKGLIDDRWPGSQVTLIADAQEHLVALLSPDDERVLHGAWSESAYLSCLQHNGLASEIRLLAAFPNDGDALQDLSLLRARPPGLASLLHEREPAV